MPSRYHPIEDGLWDDRKFDATDELLEAPGEERGFFAFLSSNKMQRPAGIYRASDGELAEASRIPIKRVKSYLADLDTRGLIVRDGGWIFVCGYLKRQARNPNLLKAAKCCVQACDSIRILKDFIERYPIFSQWLPNGCETIVKGLRNPCVLQSSILTPVPVPVPQPVPEKNILCGAEAPLLAPLPQNRIEQARKILGWLNEKAGRNFRYGDANLSFIIARLKDGILPGQLRAIITRKCREWSTDEKMCKFLRPETLFNKTKCESYLGELPKIEEEPSGN